ncbi:hypothetical protein BABINDRAFT_172697 [Babjeviella inositovora NRRL Y-12698]|uniref:DNA repair protein rhp7 treble clef domain-containing protein n=1 Tax=Babjeviella inositovora NRRL Y-12698 TaxID=984486 RepID=A0A1E3QJH2_9ASCO|nr:uncharacterized protein BABINDRAFT_172697 [Babjeviella inositovora NRRL Y-12698]ODQ77614.1 hypothetical protein BABINDRAFT_172697 [Babjeviella inositovora NRRL Y-12698]
MSRRTRGNDSSSVSGPNSALTEFLKEQGISAETIRQRHLARLRAETPDTAASEPETREASDEVEASEDELEIRIAARRKRRARGDAYTDSEDEDEYNSDEVAKKFGEVDQCVTCDKDFTLTVYSRYVENGYLCEKCNEKAKVKERNAKKNQLLARKKRQKLATALLDKQDLSRMPKLQDMCISLISEHIDQVEMLGDIGAINMSKISRILLKNRRLNDVTASLFLEPGLRELEFWDCSKVSSDALQRIPAFCPQLEKVTLSMCGQFHNANLQYFASNLRKLTHITLHGPFLISDVAWQEFFETVGSRLKGFHISNTHRFTSDSMITLLEHCPNLEELTLTRLDGLNSSEVYELIPHYLTKLRHLEISYPQNEDLITDDLLINILSINGEHIEFLNLDCCTALTDRFLTEGLRVFAPNLKSLSLKFLDQISDEGMIALFEQWDANPGLLSVNLQKCVNLTSAGLVFLLNHSGKTLVELNVNSVYGTEKLFFEDYLRSTALPLLTHLDIGFVRSVDDLVVEIIGNTCPKLALLEVYGNNRVTRKTRIREGLKLIGRQSDTI